MMQTKNFKTFWIHQESTKPTLFFPTELIYEEVIDWEERNKNGLMKEDCSGM